MAIQNPGQQYALHVIAIPAHGTYGVTGPTPQLRSSSETWKATDLVFAVAIAPRRASCHLDWI